MATDKKKRKTGEDGSYHTAQDGHGDRGRRKSKKRMVLIWNSDGDWSFQKQKNSRN